MQKVVWHGLAEISKTCSEKSFWDALDGVIKIRIFHLSFNASMISKEFEILVGRTTGQSVGAEKVVIFPM